MTFSPTPTAFFRESPPLPDLVVLDMTTLLRAAGGCYLPPTQPELVVTVTNVGPARAGRFVIAVNGEVRATVPGLPPDASFAIAIREFDYGKNEAVADASFQVRESDEDNNVLSRDLAVPESLPTCTPTPTPTATHTVIPTPTASGESPPLPDLVVQAISAVLQMANGCYIPPARSTLRVWVANVGTADSGAFGVSVNQTMQATVEGLAAGQTTSISFPRTKLETTVMVDAEFQVRESDEDNNDLTRSPVLPTPPPTCTPTPLSATATPVATRSPTPPAATPPPTPAGEADVVIACIFFDGQVSSQEPDEYVEVANWGGAAQELAGWRLTDIADGGPTFVFPAWTLDPGEAVRVYTDEIHPQ